MGLPEGSHCVRLCGQSGLGDNGEIVASVFAPHEGNELRPPDHYLSVHWLEYLVDGQYSECLAELRQYLLHSPIKNERPPTKNGRLAVIHCSSIAVKLLEEFGHVASVSHMPRLESHVPPVASIAPGLTIDEEGTVTYGLAIQQAEGKVDVGLDPHSGIFMAPEEAARTLAVQQLLASLVVYTEPGRT